MQALRLNEAKLRIATNTEPLISIACELGFSTQSHMADCFRRQFGVSPEAIRSLPRGRQPIIRSRQ